MPSPALPSEPTSAPLARDSLFSERVRWTGSPKSIELTTHMRAMAWLLVGISAVSTLLAIAASVADHEAAGRLVLFAAWTATFALLVRTVPVLFHQAARFVVTDRHVIWRCGKLRRTIQREGISFARITWHRKDPRVGDLDLVRAVPTGALHRRLTLTLQGVSAPHRVWTIMRGARSVAGSVGGGDVPLEARLDEGEVTQWAGRPMSSWRSWLPLTTKRTLTTALGGLCWMAALRSVFTAIPLVERLITGGIPPFSVGFITLVGAITLTVVMLITIGTWLLHRGLIHQVWLDRSTRYLVTNQRIILQRGRHELHVTREAVVDIAVRDGLYGGRDVYLVLDGPGSRALSAQGAFGPGEGVKGFRPMLQGLNEQAVDELREALSHRRPAPSAT